MGRPPKSNTSTKRGGTDLRLLSWVALLPIVVYAAGFLILDTYFRRRFGLPGTGEDIFKVQYLYVGFLYFMASSILIIPSIMYWVFSVRKKLPSIPEDKEGDKKIRRRQKHHRRRCRQRKGRGQRVSAHIKILQRNTDTYHYVDTYCIYMSRSFCAA